MGSSAFVHRAAVLLFTLFLLLPVARAGAQEDCILLQSSLLTPYEEAREGFAHAWQSLAPMRGPKSISIGTLTPVLLAEQPPENLIPLKKRLKGATLVVVIGDPALNFVRDLLKTPVIYLLAPSAGTLPDNFTGIDLRIPPSRQLETIGRLLPEIRAIGALYHPAQSGAWVEEARGDATRTLQGLHFKQISSPSQIPAMLEALAGTVDAYWLLPDAMVTTPEALRALRTFSMNHRVPLVSFSEKYLKDGAAAALTFDTADLGGQAAAMAARILAGTPPSEIAVATPRRQRVIINPAVLHKMHIPFNESMVDAVSTEGALP
ncbi:MAG: hypothetical protein BWK76_13320 [Desulfobulbaceae bacterium A2]|nr:MAG: hypothetical protein BWK76_13320 [Desulfobulbaceae bacterium A2]